MAQRTRDVTRTSRAEDDVRNQELLRANKELAAYFKGRRTEREARAALKIIKAFIRDREHIDPAKRRPLPGAPPPKTVKVRRRTKKSTLPPPADAVNPGASDRGGSR